MTRTVIRVVRADGWRELLLRGVEWLTPVEQARARRLASIVDRRAFLAAHVLARITAGAALGLPAAEIEIRQLCERCGGPHGRPLVASDGRERDDVHVSFAHARTAVAAIAAPVPCGIDVEAFDAEVPALALEPGEKALVNEGIAAAGLWVRKEALAKATGMALDRALAVDVRSRRLALDDTMVALRDVPVGDDLRVAIALLRSSPRALPDPGEQERGRRQQRRHGHHDGERERRALAAESHQW